MTKNWRGKLRKDWAAITGKAPKAQARPRHSLKEARQIMAALDHPDVDPRLKVALEVGYDARLGQAGRTMRSNLTLGPAGSFGLGRLEVPGAGNKLGVERDLTPSDRAAIDEALATYLAPLEHAYQAGRLPDYALFPAGRLRYNIAPSRRKRGDPPSIRQVPAEVVRDPVRAATPADDRTFNDWFRTLEELAGVQHKEGRAWYGLRRLGADIAEDHETDARVLNDLTGHADSSTRQRIYQERQRPRIKGRSARLRHHLRTEVLAGPAPADENEEDL